MQRIHVEFRDFSEIGVTGYAVVVPDEFWHDFQLFLVHAKIPVGQTDTQAAKDGGIERRLQFFPGRNVADVERVKVAYLDDRRDRFPD